MIHISNEIRRQLGRCPFVKTPFDECYCNRMNSIHIEAAIYHCGGNFEECDIYRQHAAPSSPRLIRI